jgi:hypothetical protein
MRRACQLKQVIDEITDDEIGLPGALPFTTRHDSTLVAPFH